MLVVHSREKARALEIKPRAYHSKQQRAPLNQGQNNAKDGVSHPRRAMGLVETAEAERLELFLRSIRYVQSNSYLSSVVGGVDAGI